MKREYHKWYSKNLKKDMELLTFGDRGAKVLFFPTRMARFYDYENWRIVDSLSEKIEEGHIQLFCIDSVDTETFYNQEIPPKERIKRHIKYEKYIIKEIIPFMNKVNPNPNIISAGCSLGAYHAVNLGMRYPRLFCKVVGMSGRYDLTEPVGWFADLFDGYTDKNVYHRMPLRYLKGIKSKRHIKQLQDLDIIIVIGKEDAFKHNNHQLKNVLEDKGVSLQFYEWDEEAHRAYYWRRMVKLYI